MKIQCTVRGDKRKNFVRHMQIILDNKTLSLSSRIMIFESIEVLIGETCLSRDDLSIKHTLPTIRLDRTLEINGFVGRCDHLLDWRARPHYQNLFKTLPETQEEKISQGLAFLDIIVASQLDFPIRFLVFAEVKALTKYGEIRSLPPVKLKEVVLDTIFDDDDAVSEVSEVSEVTVITPGRLVVSHFYDSDPMPEEFYDPFPLSPLHGKHRLDLMSAFPPLPGKSETKSPPKLNGAWGETKSLSLIFP